MELEEFMAKGLHLPEPLRDFHDQKDFFKAMHLLYQDAPHEEMPSWVSGHQYAIDWFLWMMASRGYTLQKCRKKGLDFKEWPNYRELLANENPELLEVKS